MVFTAPGWLLLLVLVAALLVGYVVLQFRRTRYAARFSNVELLATVAPRHPGWRRHLTFALLLIALSVLSVGAARPAGTVKVPRDRATVIIAIDISLSMQATDVAPSRIAAAQTAAKRFVDLLPPRINVGFVKFAGQASTVVPPTIDRDSVKVAIDNLDLEDYTAIGEAVFRSLDTISIFSKATTAKNDKPAPARIVLLSDGANNQGRRVSVAAKAAHDAGVPVSTIAFGTDSGTVVVDGQQIPVQVDKTALRGLAQQTGGKFFTATSASELTDVYKDIGSQIGYTTSHQDVSYRFLTVGLLFALAAGGVALLWSGRLA